MLHLVANSVNSLLTCKSALPQPTTINHLFFSSGNLRSQAFGPIEFNCLLLFFFWLLWVFTAARGLSLVVNGATLVNACYSAVHGLLMAVASLIAEHWLEAREGYLLQLKGLVAP